MDIRLSKMGIKSLKENKILKMELLLKFWKNLKEMELKIKPVLTALNKHLNLVFFKFLRYFSLFNKAFSEIWATCTGNFLWMVPHWY